MFKKNLIICFAAVLLIAGFSACQQDAGLSAPHGKFSDYTKLSVDSGTFELAKGTGYYRKQPLPTSAYYMGTRTKEFVFTATEDVKVSYSDKVYSDTYSEAYTVNISQDSEGHEVTTGTDLKKYSSKKSGLQTCNLHAGDFIRVKIHLNKYNTKESTAAEFFIWAE